MLLPQVFSVPPFLLHNMKALTKAIHPILKDNPSLCSRLSKLFTRSSHFPIPNLFNWYILSWSHLLIQFLSASPVPIYTLYENTHPASACQICTFHFSSWELLSSKEHSHQGWFWFLYTIQASPPLPALGSGHSIRYCSDRVLGISIMWLLRPCPVAGTFLCLLLSIQSLKQHVLWNQRLALTVQLQYNAEEVGV